MRNFLQNISLLLIGLALPLTMYSKGLFFAAIILGLLCGFLSLRFNQIKNVIISFNFTDKKIIFLLPVLCSIVLSVVFSINVEYSLKKLIDVLLVLLVSGLLIILLSAIDKQKYVIIFKVMLGLFVFNIVFLYYDMFVASDSIIAIIHGADNVHPGRVRYGASQLAVVAPLLFGFIYYSLNRKYLSYGFLALVFITILFSGGRSALLCFVVSILAMFAIMVYFKVIKLSVSKALLAFFAFILLFFCGLCGYKIYDEKSGYKEFETRIVSLNSAGRIDIWKYALNASFIQPITGIGIGSYRSLTAVEKPKLTALNHPHNFILEVFVSTGLLGLGVVLMFLAIIFLDLWQKIKSQSLFAIFVTSSYISYWVNSLTSVSILQTYWLAFFAVMVIIASFYIKE